MFLRKGQNVKLNRAKSFPGYEVVASEETIIDSITSNPFFHGFNILALSKKMKGFRNNADLNKILTPVVVQTGIQVDLNENQFVTFIPDKKFADDLKLLSVRDYFSSNDLIQPSFINLGMKDVKVRKGENLGIILVQSVDE